MIDFHVHVFPEDFIKKRKELAQKDGNFAVIYSSEKAKMASPNDILNYVDSYSLEYAIVFGFTWLSNDLNRLHNELVGELAKKCKKVVPFAVVNPFSPGWKKEAERCLGDGFKGFGEISFYMGKGILTRDEWVPFMEFLREASSPLLLHVNESVGHKYPGKADIKLEEIYLFVKKFPENTIILAHMGGGIFFYELMKKVREEFKNVLYDTAASPFLFGSKVYPVFERICGVEKLLFGTDYPLLKPERYIKEIKEFGCDELLEAASEGNPKRLLNLE